jgi:flagellar P-ring protein precursor FlgI
MLATLLFVIAQGSTRPSSADVSVRAGSIEAPRQPEGVSTSTVLRGPRYDIAPGAGTAGRVTVRIGDLVAVRGQEENQIQGLGLVTGLAGTGDATTAARQAIINLLKTQNIVLDLQAVTSANTAVVLVQATLEPGIKPGRQMDVRVSSLYDCESLVGGILLSTELTDMTGTTVFATAAGPITTGGFSAEGEGASAKRNHLTVGTIPLGGKIEREVETQMVSDHGFVYLDLRALKGSFENATRIANAVNGLYPSMAVAQDPMTVAVRVPGDLPKESTVAFISSLLTQEIEPAAFARVVVNERTGVIVMGEGVRISRGAITKGNLTVTIAETAEASQPGPFTNGRTEVLPRTSLLVEEEDRPLTIVNGAVTLAEVVEVLNVLGVTPRDMIQILQLMAQSGMLHAEVLVM